MGRIIGLTFPEKEASPPEKKKQETPKSAPKKTKGQRTDQ